MSVSFNPRLYLVTDRACLAGRDLIKTVLAAVRGGVTLVQLREKTRSTRDFVAEVRALKNVLDGTGVALLVNDRVDVALAAGADGVHLGQSDMAPADARWLLGPNAIIGWSLESVDDARALDGQPVDYAAVSPVFSTPTKTDIVPPLGLAGVRAVRALTTLPLVGIGGIHAGNARDVLAAGADGVAVISAICSAENPETAARAFFTPGEHPERS
ncbi:MAG: thiamine phosphate synthase [Spartobacteria bacterium]|nr:thiamine phosphate synthase [Spartobacteria bacterium]